MRRRLEVSPQAMGIGEAAARMETMSNQPILTLKLTKGEHKRLETWRRQYLG